MEFLFVAMLQTVAGQPSATPNADLATAEQAVPDSVQRRRARDVVRCRNQTVTGSRMGSRVCLSQAEEEAMQRETQRIADEMHRPGPFGEGSSTMRCAEIGRNC